ncbi:hypothetical protein JCM6882_000138 [Rhodosporidiobolus microsporus]
MDADLSQPPPPPPPPPGGSASPPPSASAPTSHSSSQSSSHPPRPSLNTRRSTRRRPTPTAPPAATAPPPGEQGQLDPGLTKWEEWDREATSLEVDWVVEDDMAVLAKALSDEPSPLLDDPGSPTSLHAPSGGFSDGAGLGGGGGAAVEKISAVSDFAPIKQRVKRGPKRRKDVVREGWAYHVSRWPLLLLIFFIILLEFLAYLFVRQMVNVIEFFSSWRGERGRLRLALRNAKTYEEWKSVALALDAHLSLNAWKKHPQNAYYDAPLVRRVLRALRDLRAKEDAEGVAAVLHAVLRSNWAGTESFRLYSESYYGTKELVQEYVDEVTASLLFLRSTPAALFPLEDKADFFRSVAKNLGASALCLSGGASFGYYHFGVVRALLDQDLLPRVVTGTSAGAIVAAFLCTRTNAELSLLLTPTLADRITACEEPFTKWVQRAWRTGARFDTVQWARKASFFTMGNMTFREAYERTGRVLNVSVIPYDTHSPTKLLNYLTAPDCVIYTAVIASAAVPGIINPVVLLTKDKNGRVKPWEFQGKHKDGSLRVDIPLHSLHLLYNVNFSIVSQSNPHIHLFQFSPRGSPGHPVAHRRGRGWRGGFWLSAAEQFWKIEMVKWFRIIRDLELLPEFGGQNWSAVFLQKFEGTVTIWPKSRFVDWFRILTDPDRKELERMIRVGQGVTWPKIKMIENRLKIERQVDLGRDEVRKALASQPSSSTSTSAAANNDGDSTSPTQLRPSTSRPHLMHHGSSSSSNLHSKRSSRSSRSRSRAATLARADIDRDATYGSSDDLEEDEDDGEEGEGEEEHAREADVEERGGTFDSAAAADAPPEQAPAPTATPAKRRQAILAKLGLGRAAAKGARGAEGGGGEEERYSGSGGGGSGSGGGRRAAGTTDESDWTSGGEGEQLVGAGVGERGTNGNGHGATRGGKLRRRRFSMSTVIGGGEEGRRKRAGTIGSSEDDAEGWGR